MMSSCLRLQPLLRMFDIFGLDSGLVVYMDGMQPNWHLILRADILAKDPHRHARHDNQKSNPFSIREPLNLLGQT